MCSSDLAGIVLCQYWSERKRHLLVICPASLRKQWALELQQKFSLPAIVLDQKTSKDFIKKGISPLQQKSIVILSYNYACRIKDDIKKIPWHLVVIDEAYQDFSTNISWNKRLNDFKNLVVINTFSKSWGMANARLGMLYANEQIIQYMNTIKMPYNVNQHTIDLALQALSRRAIKNNFVQQLVAGREWLELQMKSIPLIHKIYPSDTNYILFKVDDADKLYKYLLTKKVIIRNRDKAPLLKGCLRVSVGTPEENQKFIDALKSFTE